MLLNRRCSARAVRSGVIGPKRRIATFDSIESRLHALLLYLAGKEPLKRWGQYLDSNKQIVWSKLVLSGQSQGGGHAYVLAKIHKVARVIMTGSPKDYNFKLQTPARGFDSNTATPIDRFFAFNHISDNGHGCLHDQQMAVLKQMGLVSYGVVDVDRVEAASGFKHAHVIFATTDLPGKRYHGSVIGGKMPSCIPAWQYMLTETVK